MRTALVTGASSGIGAACALGLAASGWRVFAGVRSEGAAPAATEEILLDVANPDDIARASRRIGELDALVNNAGIAISMPLEFIPLDELRRQLEVNVIGQVAVTQAFLPQLRRARGRIVFVGSIAGRSALPFLGAYAASKFAIEALADALRVELGPWGMHVSVVEPGSIATPIWRKGAQIADEILSRAPPAVDELYGRRIDAFRKLAAERGARGIPPDDVARVVERALTADRPRARYVVGRDAWLRAGFELLPTRARDRLLERVVLRDA